MIYIITKVILIIFSLGYLYFLLCYIKSFIKAKKKNCELQVLSECITKFSIIIALRNEEFNIIPCLDSLKNLNYPFANFEIILVDDESTDNTSILIHQYKSITKLNIKIINTKNYVSVIGSRGKKKAIEYGIIESSFTWIVTTDGDCLLPHNWLRVFNTIILNQPCQMIVAPVCLIYYKGLGQAFQGLDFMSLQGITAGMVSTGKFTLANGANLAYNKQAFNEVKGFLDINNILSGDDMLLLDKFQNKYSKQEIVYVLHKEAIVTTYPVRSILAFLNQRVRWGAKWKLIKNKYMLLGGIFAYFFHLIALVSWLIIYKNWLLLVLIFFIKLVLEFYFLFIICSFFNRKNYLKRFFEVQLIYFFYLVVIGLFTLKTKIDWKGRA